MYRSHASRPMRRRSSNGARHRPSRDIEHEIDPLRPDRDATSFAYVLGAGWRPVDLADVKVEFEHDMNRLVGQRYRIVGMLNLWWGTR